MSDIPPNWVLATAALAEAYAIYWSKTTAEMSERRQRCLKGRVEGKGGTSCSASGTESISIPTTDFVETAELKDIMGKNPELADNSDGKIAWIGDALNRLLGDDKPGHVHGNFRSNGYHWFEPSVDGHNSNRKRVLAPPVDGLRLVKRRPSNLQNKQSGSNGADLQTSNNNSVSDKNEQTMVHNGGSARQLEKCSAAPKNQETSDHNFSAWQGEINSATQKNVVQNKETLLEAVSARQGEKTSASNKLPKKTTTKGANASSKSSQSASLSWLGANELPVGIKIFLKSLKKYSMDVALATIVSCNPKLNLMVLKLEINSGRCMSIWHLRKLTIWYGVAKTAILSVMLEKQRLHGLQSLFKR
ncbi:uncharacterized protein [Triticum aestivum]|uniref:uncharacterized protein n=1 Tax=Triticum aestivum TaxID=4565 RepID=UPI001D02BE58|nr:uncharacterized protein LOC123114742 [Triticum aestivum]